jgi:hypothetical protein
MDEVVCIEVVHVRSCFAREATGVRSVSRTTNHLTRNIQVGNFRIKMVGLGNVSRMVARSYGRDNPKI